MARIIQRLMPELRMGVTITRKLYDPSFYVQWWADRSYKHLIERKKDLEGKPFTKESAIEFIKMCEKNGKFAFASGPIPANHNQHGVFAYAVAGIGKEIFEHEAWADKRVRYAYKSLFEDDVQVIKPAQASDTDGDEYQEDPAALEAMRDAFCPSVDIVYHGDLPDPEPEDVYEVYTDQEAEELECSDLPE